jgi:hypothetical protein
MARPGPYRLRASPLAVTALQAAGVDVLALGDPNDDGRGELLLALWKRDAEGVPRSHPFLIGYREGAYRVLWGGSAVVDPILEVELGDVDGDGVQELVVLEDMDNDRAVSVWRWHGWGFSLLWRSPPGRYRDLALVRGRIGQPLVIAVAGLPKGSMRGWNENPSLLDRVVARRRAATRRLRVGGYVGSRGHDCQPTGHGNW